MLFVNTRRYHKYIQQIVLPVFRTIRSMLEMTLALGDNIPQVPYFLRLALYVISVALSFLLNVTNLQAATSSSDTYHCKRTQFLYVLTRMLYQFEKVGLPLIHPVLYAKA